LSYDTILDLDRQIRDFSIPKAKLADSRCIVVQKVSLSTALEVGESAPRSEAAGINDIYSSSTTPSAILHPSDKYARGRIQSKT